MWWTHFITTRFEQMFIAAANIEIRTLKQNN